MVEPFRPFVDREVWSLTGNGIVSAGAVSPAERRVSALILIRAADFGAETDRGDPDACDAPQQRSAPAVAADARVTR
jgi:hypothetical protein